MVNCRSPMKNYPNLRPGEGTPAPSNRSGSEISSRPVLSQQMIGVRTRRQELLSTEGEAIVLHWVATACLKPGASLNQLSAVPS